MSKNIPTAGHTPTPWSVTTWANHPATIRGGVMLPGAEVPPAIAKMVGGKFSATAMANAALIIRAVNTHHALVAALGVLGADDVAQKPCQFHQAPGHCCGKTLCTVCTVKRAVKMLAGK